MLSHLSTDKLETDTHKLVLSACSDFFKSILRNNSHSHPLLYLSGIQSTNLSLIGLIEDWKIEGLTSDSSAVGQEEYEDLKYTDGNGIFTLKVNLLRGQNEMNC